MASMPNGFLLAHSQLSTKNTVAEFKFSKTCIDEDFPIVKSCLRLDNGNEVSSVFAPVDQRKISKQGRSQENKFNTDSLAESHHRFIVQLKKCDKRKFDTRNKLRNHSLHIAELYCK